MECCESKNILKEKEMFSVQIVLPFTTING